MECLAEIVEVGPEVQGLKPGDLAIPMVRRPCHHPECLACRADRQDFCYTGDYQERGIKQLHGFLTERIVDEAHYMNPVPKAIRDVAVLVELLTIAEKGLIQAAGIQSRMPWGGVHQAVVLGAGPKVGLLGAMALRRVGFAAHCLFAPSRARSGGGNREGDRGEIHFVAGSKRSNSWPRRWAISMWCTKRPECHSLPS